MNMESQIADGMPKPKQGVTMAKEVNTSDAKPGLYRHPKTGATVITTEDELTGNAMSEGAVRVGFEFVRPAQPGEIKRIGAPSEQVGVKDGALTGVEARLKILEKADEDRKKTESEKVKLEEEVKKLSAELEAEKKKSQAPQSDEDKNNKKEKEDKSKKEGSK